MAANPQGQQVIREIWIAYPVIDSIHKSRGSAWLADHPMSGIQSPPPMDNGWDHYTSSHIRLQCKDFTFYSFDFANEVICNEAYTQISQLALKMKRDNQAGLYARSYRPNVLELGLEKNGWQLYDAETEYRRLGLDSKWWRICNINSGHAFSPSYPAKFVVPASISDNVVKHAGKFRSKQRIPVVVYRHRGNHNHNVISRCAQPLVGINFQKRSIQDEQLVGDIFRSQDREKMVSSQPDELEGQQTQKNLIIDLRPLTNAMAQHALGSGTENIDNYRGKQINADSDTESYDKSPSQGGLLSVDKIYGNIDNIHVIRASLNKLTALLDEMDRGVVDQVLVQQQLVKTMWLHRVSIILQSVDRIIKSVHLNNTNVMIHCSDGWDRTSQVSSLSQMCLDPYYRTLEGFMVLIEKEWVSFGFKFATRADHGGCIGALKTSSSKTEDSESSIESLPASTAQDEGIQFEGAARKVASFFQRAAQQVKQAASDVDTDRLPIVQTYSGSNEKSPVFHQFLDCVYQIWRQHPQAFEFNSRFLKRLLYHYYSCQYGSFLCDNENELSEGIRDQTVSVWDYFLSRPQEFTNSEYRPQDPDSVVFFNFSDVRWWCELYGRTEEEMNGMANKLEQRFAQMLREPGVTQGMAKEAAKDTSPVS